MKRGIIILALVLVASASFCQGTDGKKEKKKKGKKATVEAPVTLSTTADSLSYAMGMDATNGLIPYLQQQLGVDTAYMYKFLEGFKAAFDKEQNNKELTAFSAGIQIAKMLEDRMVPQAIQQMSTENDSVNGDLFYRGFLASLQKDTTIFNGDNAQKYVIKKREAIKQEKEKKQEELNQANIKKSMEFLTINSTKEGVKTTSSGLQYKVLKEGHGEIATKDDEVEVKYEGRLIDGTIFDSSYERNPQTTKFRPTQVIKGWTEALTMMPEGSIWELYIPYTLAYGERAAGEIPPCSTLIFKVELIKVIKK